MKDIEVPIEVLGEVYRADLDAGLLWWRERPAEHFLIERDARATNKKKAGQEAVGYLHHGARWLRFRYRGELVRTSAHRVIFALAHGRWPEGEIDHVDGHEAGDGIGNLREATHQQNLQNMTRARKNNTSGFIGVVQVGERWIARISVNGRSMHLGGFATPEEAHEAYLAARKEHFTFAPQMRD